MPKVTIKIEHEVWRKVNASRKSSETFSDVINRMADFYFENNGLPITFPPERANGGFSDG